MNNQNYVHNVVDQGSSNTASKDSLTLSHSSYSANIMGGAESGENPT